MKPLLPNEVLVVLGGHNLERRFEVGRAIRTPSKIYIHPDWNPQSEKFDADIAIIELETPVIFSNYIQPICLWESYEDPLETSGLAIGYGKSEDQSKKHENIPKLIKMPLVSLIDCILNNPDLATISSQRTFCGGDRNGTGVCLGDSGGGLVIKSNNLFYLHGIISSSLLSSSTCDLNNYSIFTNVLKFNLN